MLEMSILSGKVIVITGAGRGLGRAMAERCAAEGARVAVLGRDARRGQAAADALTGGGGEALFVQADITHAGAMESAAQKIYERWGSIDGLVNNAALATGLGGQPFEKITEDEWDRVMSINVKGTWLACRATAPYLRAAGHGKIVNITSDVALWGGDLFLHYVASKGAVVSMTRALARELGPDNVTVNAVAPGLTPTEATEGVSQRRRDQYSMGQILKREPVPGDIVGAVAFLLSEDSDFMTGQVLVVDGGLVVT